MATLIKKRRIHADSWQQLEAGPDGALPEVPAAGDVIVPLAAWRAARAALLARPGRLGVRLDASEGPETVAGELEHFALVAVHFPKSSDGRGYSTARLLRERHGYRGELRAVGDVLRDQLLFLEQCGFDAFALREGEDAEEALRAFDDFSEAYQASAGQPIPLFRRRLAGEGRVMSAALPPRVAGLDHLLGRIARDHAPSALASSLSAEDMVITDRILRLGLDIEVFTLDTGRLHADTLGVVDAIRERYGYAVRVLRPEAAAVAAYVTAFGRDAFYESAELRKRCCAIRKVAPLEVALRGKRSWITGQRRAQAATRVTLPLQEDDAAYGLTKFNPLADWSEDQVWAYVRAHEVPYNPLYDQGYRSIGCAPCTRPTVAGEDVRAGRWWWEDAAARECGLHPGPDGRLVRTKETAS